MMTYTHKHHIIPKHIGGPDISTNIVELTIEEHAEAHRILYENHGRWQDYLAWKAISGIIGHEEVIWLANSLAAKNRIGEKNTFFGKKHTEKTNEKNRQAHLGHTYNRGRIHTDETKKNMSLAHIGKIPWNKEIKCNVVVCPHCELKGGSNAMKRYHFENCKLKEKQK